jgi:rare lipoprotein A (peptidoglycan hydrolase)
MRRFVVVLLCFVAIAASTQDSRQSWQGNAAVARSGEFETPGLVAASNAFPQNTSILVQNAETGQSVQVTVVGRVQGAGKLFLLLSEEAADRIGLTGSEVIRVEVKTIGSPGTELSETLREEAYSADPDLNPPVSVPDEQVQAASEAPSAPEEPKPEEESVEIAQATAPESRQPEAAEAEQPEEQPEAAEPGISEEAAGPSEAEEQEPAPEPETRVVSPAAPQEPRVSPEEKRLQELEERVPQKQLYMPPRQQELYALAPEPGEPEEAEVAAAEQPPEEEVPAEQPPEEEVPEEELIDEPPAERVADGEEVEEEVAEAEIEAQEPPEEPMESVEEEPRVSMTGPKAEEEPLEVALPGPQAAEPEKPSPEGTRLPVPEEERPLAMEPEEPPTEEIEAAAAETRVEEPVPEAAEEVGEEPVEELAAVPPVEDVEPERLVLSEMLPSQTYFVQLGAYSTRGLAEKLAGDLTQTYSVTILPASSEGRRFYKVLVGPLNVDESGTLLYQFRSRGFEDAFIQYVE